MFGIFSFIGAAALCAGVLIGMAIDNPPVSPSKSASQSLTFDPAVVYPVVPVAKEREYSSRSIGAFYWVREVNRETTTVVYDNVVTAPCDFSIPTKNVNLEESIAVSYIRFKFKPEVDLASMYTCENMVEHIETVTISAEPEVHAQFAIG